MTIPEAVKYLTIEKQRLPSDFYIKKRNLAYDMAIEALSAMERSAQNDIYDKTSDS